MNQSYTENELNEIQILANDYLEDLQIKLNENNTNEYRNIFKNVTFENDLIGFKKHILDTINVEDSSKQILQNIVPYLYELKKRTSRISSLSDFLFKKISSISGI